MELRRAPRILPGPETSVALRIPGAETMVSMPLLDQSVDGLAVQAGRHSKFSPGDTIEVRIGDHWEQAVVMSADRKGALVRVGIKWLEEYQEPTAEELFGLS